MIELIEQHPSYSYLAPMLLLAAAGLVMLAADLVFTDAKGRLAGIIGIVALAAAAFLSCSPPAADIGLVSALVKDLVAQDAFARYFDLLFCVAGIAVIAISFSYKPLTKYAGEYYAIIALCTSAFMFLAASTNLLMIYLCIEFIGISCYILAAYLKNDPRSGEGAIKYLLTGGAASAFMVYGMSILYGFTGSLNIAVIGAAAAGGAVPAGALYASLVLVLVGFGFKIAMAPFHMWAPDAYEGAPTPVTAFFSVAPKAAGIAALLRVMLVMFPARSVDWIPALTVLSIVTMTAGNVIAIWQGNVKRMLAYSSISHVGYILIGLIVAGARGLDTPDGKLGLLASMVYIAVYILTNLGAFAAVIVASNTLEDDNLDRYSGLGRRAPYSSACLSFFLLSLAGIPPTAGFIGKFFLFMASIGAGFHVLAFFLAANSVVSLYYYWNVVRRMYIGEPAEATPVRAAAPLAVVITLAAASILALGLFFQPLMEFASKSAL